MSAKSQAHTYIFSSADDNHQKVTSKGISQIVHSHIEPKRARAPDHIECDGKHKNETTFVQKQTTNRKSEQPRPASHCMQMIRRKVSLHRLSSYMHLLLLNFNRDAYCLKEEKKHRLFLDCVFVFVSLSRNCISSLNFLDWVCFLMFFALCSSCVHYDAHWQWALWMR